jgi:predicted outer membrane repeat protein
MHLLYWLDVTFCRFIGNKADEDGAAIHASQWGMMPSRVEVHDSYFEGNEVRMLDGSFVFDMTGCDCADTYDCEWVLTRAFASWCSAGCSSCGLVCCALSATLYHHHCHRH